MLTRVVHSVRGLWSSITAEEIMTGGISVGTDTSDVNVLPSRPCLTRCRPWAGGGVVVMIMLITMIVMTVMITTNRSAGAFIPIISNQFKGARRVGPGRGRRRPVVVGVVRSANIRPRHVHIKYLSCKV